MRAQDAIYELDEAADIAGMAPAALKRLIAAGKFTPSLKTTWVATQEVIHRFSEADIERLLKFVGPQSKPAPQTKFIDDGVQEFFSVDEIAAMWNLSGDTIRRMFEDETGVITLGEKNPRGKRRRVTMRIPRAVMERVKKRRSNP
jgi:hypothetical protein